MRAELIGKTYARWTVTAAPKRKGYVVCRCACGVIRQVQADSLKRGTSTSCGCKTRQEGVTHGACIGGRLTPEYRCWSNMLSRCRNGNHQAYERYGGRGIEVAPRWEVFSNFIADMGLRPTSKHSLERRKNTQGYSKSNCYWATRGQQENNKRNNHPVTAFGETKNQAQWVGDPRCIVCEATFKWRLREGWPPELAMFTPPHGR